MKDSDKPEKDTILYVDDDPYSLVLFNDFMKEEYEVLTAVTTTKGYELLKTNHVKVLITDQRMPDETGLEFIERITPEYPELVKIIFTAHIDHDATLKAINQGGIFRYVLKPWNFSEMQQTLQNAISEYMLKTENKKLFNQLVLKNEVLKKTYLKIREKEKKFTSIFQASSDGMALIREDRILEVNQAFLKIAGIESESYSKEVLSKYMKNQIPYVFSYLDTKSVSSNSSVEFIDLNKKFKYLELDYKKFNHSGEELILVIARDITERKMMEQKIMETIFQTQEASQNLYAQELHDGLGPVLSTVKMYIEWLCNDKKVLNRQIIENKAMHAIDEAINQAKEIANNLSPHILQRFGLINALKNYISYLESNKEIQFVIQSKINERLPPDKEIMLYRVLLECINNSVKHAEPASISVNIERLDNKIIVYYSDKGKGFDVEKILSETTGMGLANIQNRIKLIGGEITINSIVGTGTNIKIILTRAL